MKAKLFQNKLCVQKSPIHGYGVFAQQDIQEGDIVEECLGLPLDCLSDDLINYVFNVKGQIVLLMGFGSIYNHADDPNVAYEYDVASRVMTLKAKRLIREGEEIFISYGKNWFSFRHISAKKTPFWRKLFRPVTYMLLRTVIVLIGLVSLFYLLPVLLKIFK